MDNSSLESDIQVIDGEVDEPIETYPVFFTLEELEALIFADENQEYDVLQHVQAFKKIAIACLAATRNEYTSTDDDGIDE